MPSLELPTFNHSTVSSNVQLSMSNPIDTPSRVLMTHENVTLSMSISNQQLELQCQISSKEEPLTIDLSRKHSRLMREYIFNLCHLLNQRSCFTYIKPGDIRIFFNRVKQTHKHQDDPEVKVDVGKFKPYTSGTQRLPPRFFTELKRLNAHEKHEAQVRADAQLAAASSCF